MKSYVDIQNYVESFKMHKHAYHIIRKIEYEYNICYENKSLCDLHRQKEKYKKLRCKY